MSDKQEKEISVDVSIGDLIKRVLMGKQLPPDADILRNIVAEGLGGTDESKTAQEKSHDLQELMFTQSVLLLAELEKLNLALTARPMSAIVLQKGEILVQVWSREDGMDRVSRPLTDYEKTMLFQHFGKKSSEK